MSDILFEQGVDLTPVISEGLKLASGKAGIDTQNHNWSHIISFLRTEIIDPISDVLVDVTPIGQWNMNLTTIKIVQVGIDWDETRPISDVSVVIYDDNSNVYHLDYSGTEQGNFRFDGNEVWLMRKIGGLFDSTSFQLTTLGSLSYNRGYITIRYQETG